MSSFLKRLLSCGVAALLAFMLSPAQANVLLTFKVNNITLQTCTGLQQPNCTITDVSTGFDETVLIGSIPQAPPTDASSGSILQSAAFFNFPLSMTGAPYTSALRASVSGPVTWEQSFTRLENGFDQAGAAGSATAGIFSNLYSDTTDALGVRTQQGYELGYTLFDQFSDLLSYTDLVDQSIDAFFSKYIGTMAGFFTELGTSSTFDPSGLRFTDYAFSEYQGRVTLIGVQLVDPAAVPEPGSLALLLAATLAMLCARRRGPLRANAASSH